MEINEHRNSLTLSHFGSSVHSLNSVPYFFFVPFLRSFCFCEAFLTFAFGMALALLDPRFAAALIGIGFTNSRTLDAGVDDLDDALSLVGVLKQRGFTGGDNSDLAGELLSAVEASRPGIKRHRSQVANPTLVDRATALADLRSAALAASLPPPQHIGAPPKPPVRSKTFRTAWHRAQAQNSVPGARAAEEERLRLLWANAVADQLVYANYPVVADAVRCSDPREALLQCTGTSRGRTLRQHSRKWGALTRWLLHARQTKAPTDPAQLVDYLRTAVTEGCAPSFPRTLAAALVYFEQRGGVAPCDRVSESQLWLNAVASHSLQLAAGKPECKKAPAFVFALLVALELLVLNETQPEFVRALAWVRLVKVWAALRTDDLQGVVPSLLQLHEGHLEGRLQRTKTSGNGKTTSWLPFVVDKTLDLVGRGWLQAGFTLWSSSQFNFDRDYLVPRPTADLRGVQHKLASPTDLAGYQTAVLRELKVPVRSGSTWQESSHALLSPTAAAFWTGHSERNFLPTYSATLGVPSADIDRLGRWRVRQSAVGSDDYTRSHRVLVRKTQRAVLAKWLTGTAAQEFKEVEDEILRELSSFLLQHGFSPEQVAEQRDLLQGVAPPPDYEEDDSDGEQKPALVSEPVSEPTLESSDSTLTITQTASVNRTFKYWIALTRRGVRSKEYTRRLHIVDGCYLSRGTFQGEFELVQDVETAFFHYTCKRCFPPKNGAQCDDSVSSNAESSSSDELQVH